MFDDFLSDTAFRYPTPKVQLIQILLNQSLFIAKVKNEVLIDSLPISSSVYKLVHSEHQISWV